MRHSVVTLINLICGNQKFLYLLGKLNERTNFLSTVFVMYPATPEYADAYIPKNKLHIMRWKPYIVGFFIQNGRLGLKCVISSEERDFRDTSNLENLRSLVDTTNSLKDILYASQTSFSGVLPGILNEHRIIKGSPEAKVTVATVVKSEETLRNKLNISEQIPTVVLGGAGFIGRRVVRELKKRDRVTLVIDPKVTNEEKNWQEVLKNQDSIILNLAPTETLKSYLDHITTDSILLNESYPEPCNQTQKTLKDLGIAAYHISGVKARSFPTFPMAYKGGIPCCAARLTEGIKPLIKQLF